MKFTDTTEAVVAAARDMAAETERQRAQECDGSRGKAGSICRERETDKRNADAALTEAERQMVLTDAVRSLDWDIVAAQRWLDDNKATLRKSNEAADPQSKATVDAIIFAIAVEIGSGLLPWLLFSQAHGRRAEVAEVPPAPDTLETVRQRFFDTVVIPRRSKFVIATTMYRAYVLWCNDNRHIPTSLHEFGTCAPWPKKKVGSMRYVDCELAGRYAPRQLRVVVTN